MRTLRLATTVSLISLLAVGPNLSSALAQGKMTEEVAPKEIVLTQKQIDGLISAEKEVRDVESKLPQGNDDKPDAKVTAALDAIAKKNGFANLGEYTDASSSVSIVMAGMDAETKAYVGPQAVIKKQIAEVEADKSMPPKEKKEALEELKAAMAPAASAQPSAANIALVSKNYDKLSKSMQQDAD